MIITSFTAPKGGGKDASAKILLESQIAAGKLSFAGPMKQICSQVFGISRESMEDPVLKEKLFDEPFSFSRKHLRLILNLLPEFLPTDELDYNVNTVTETGVVGATMKSIRNLLQFVGTEVIRNKVHVEWNIRAAFANKVLESLDPNGIYCITDARYPNEYSFLQEKFGDDLFGYYVERPEAEERLKTATHTSETDIIKVRALIGEGNVIKNDGSLEELAEKIKALPFTKGDRPKSAASPKKKGKFKFANASGKTELV